jgi:hypothetical protein
MSLSSRIHIMYTDVLSQRSRARYQKDQKAVNTLAHSVTQGGSTPKPLFMRSLSGRPACVTQPINVKQQKLHHRAAAAALRSCRCHSSRNCTIGPQLLLCAVAAVTPVQSRLTAA